MSRILTESQKLARLEATRKWRMAHPERAKELAAKYRAAYRARDPDYLKSLSRAWDAGALASISEESANLAKEALARTLRKGWVSQVARSVSKLTD